MEQQQAQNDPLTRFVDEIITAKQLPGVTDEVRAQLVSDMRKRLTDQIDRAVINAMSEEKAEEFNRLLDDPQVTAETVQTFIASSGVDVQRVTLETMLRFRDLYLNPPKGKTE